MSALLQHHHRVREIASVASRYGLGWLVTAFGLDHAPLLGRLVTGGGLLRRGNAAENWTQPQRLRMALEELGTPFIKLGQILSMRDDLLPPEYIIELRALREHLRPVPADEIFAIIEAELSGPLDAHFARVEPVPLATASIGQVHAATLHSGEAVVIKVQRPHVAELIEQDLAILRQLASFAQGRGPLARNYDLPALMDEFAWTLRNELDFLQEGRNAERFREGFADNPMVVIPAIRWEQTTPRVLTMQRIDGIRLDDLAALDAAGIDRPALAKRAADVILHEVFTLRIFHADPHPGNFAVQPDGALIAWDFGMVGRISPRTARSLLAALRAMARDDAERAIDALIDLDIVEPSIDRAPLLRDLERLMTRYRTARIGEHRIEQVIVDVTTLIRQHQLRLPGDLALLLKTLGMHEASARRLDPNFTPLEVATPYVRQAVLERFYPRAWGPRLMGAGDDTLDLLLDAPQRIDRLLTQLERSGIQTTTHLAEGDRYLDRLQMLVNRLVIAWLTGTSLIALAVMLAIYQPGWLEGWLGPLFWVGAMVTFLSAAALVLAVSRRRQR